MDTSYRSYEVSIAPMMGYTDLHFRYLIRLLSKRVLLYTEMITSHAILFGKRYRLLQHNPQEHPLAIQFGGSVPADLAICARIAEDYGYDEFNLNVGCPSNRVRNGNFGACLMKRADIIVACVEAIQRAASIPISIKLRTGVDKQNSYAALYQLIDTVRQAGCSKFIIHARDAILGGMSPRQNRTIPPLRYDMVWRIKQDFPELTIIINGGIRTMTQIQQQLKYVDGIMIGREAYRNPYFMSRVDQELFYLDLGRASRRQIIDSYLLYMEQQLAKGFGLQKMKKHLGGLFYGQAGARLCRRVLNDQSFVHTLSIGSIRKALHRVL